MLEDQVAAPDWVPPAVVRVAQMILMTGGSLNLDSQLALTRLIHDQRMKTVWSELLKHQRDNYRVTQTPFHDSKLPKEIESWDALAQTHRQRAADFRELGGNDEAAWYDNEASFMESRHKQIQNSEITLEQRRELALVDLFSRAVAAYASGTETITRKEFGQYLGELRASGQSGVADAYERQASSEVGSRFLVDRRRTDARLEAFVETIALETNTLFGQPHFGTIATITNVTFDRSDFSRQRIRTILK
tara:strand:- start:21718 stop:22461 length:744 start_codon:yes stop_codon:yes gene_type:complete